MTQDKPTLKFQSVPQFVFANLPWVLLGVVVMVGGLSTIFYGLPWAQKSDVDKLAEIVAKDHETIQSISQTQAVAATQQQVTANILARIQDRLDKQEEYTQQNSIHIEGLEADEKSREAQEHLRR